MTLTLTRRELLRAAAVTAAASARAGAAPARRRVGIVGGGMAGVALAWMLDGARDVVLLESRASVGGHVQSITVNVDGQPVVVDMGAQFFHPGPYPLYSVLVAQLGVATHAFPASITVTAAGELLPRVVSPVLPDRVWPLVAPWNKEGVAALAVAFAAAKGREERDESWALTLEEWLPSLGLSQAQWEGVLLPWAASLFSGSIDQARGLSARAAMIFAAKALPDNPLEPLLYHVVTNGMIEPLDAMLAQCSTVQVLTGAVVRQVSRPWSGGFHLACADGSVRAVDDLVFASSGPGTLQLLATLPGTLAQRLALQGIEFHDAELTLHADPLYAPQPVYRSFLNSHVAGPFCEASMWMAPVLAAAPPAARARLWKSWTTHREQLPAAVLYQAAYRHMLPTPATLAAQAALGAMQGNGGIWFAGGYLYPYDSQETALRSAMAVARGLGVPVSLPRQRRRQATLQIGR